MCGCGAVEHGTCAKGGDGVRRVATCYVLLIAGRPTESTRMSSLAHRALHDLRARYLALASYEDVGTVVLEGKEILSFHTEFHRASRRLTFSAREGDRMVCDLDSVDLRVTRRQVADALTRCVPDDGELGASWEVRLSTTLVWLDPAGAMPVTNASVRLPLQLPRP